MVWWTNWFEETRVSLKELIFKYLCQNMERKDKEIVWYLQVNFINFYRNINRWVYLLDLVCICPSIRWGGEWRIIGKISSMSRTWNRCQGKINIFTHPFCHVHNVTQSQCLSRVELVWIQYFYSQIFSLNTQIAILITRRRRKCSDSFLIYSKCKRPHPGFELGLTINFLITITASWRVPHR